MTQQYTLKQAWEELPVAYRKDIGKVVILKNKIDTIDGVYNWLFNYITINMSIGISHIRLASVLWHEIMHHAFYSVYTIDEKYAWRLGMFEILLESESSPTEYMDTFLTSNHMKKINHLRQEYKALSMINADNIPIWICFPWHDYMVKKLDNYRKHYSSRFNKFIWNVSFEEVQDLEHKVKNMQDLYKNMPSRKKSKIASEYVAEQKQTLIMDNYDMFGAVNNFYVESHAEIGMEVYRRKTSIDTTEVTISSSNNKDIEKYIKLFKNIFGE